MRHCGAAGILALLRNLKHSNEAASPPSRRRPDHLSSQDAPGSDTDRAASPSQSMSSSPLTPRRNSPLHKQGLPLTDRQAPPRPSPGSEQRGRHGEGPAMALAQAPSAGPHKARSRSLSYPQPKLRLDPQRAAPLPFSPASSPEHVVHSYPIFAWLCNCITVTGALSCTLRYHVEFWVCFHG